MERYSRYCFKSANFESKKPVADTAESTFEGKKTLSAAAATTFEGKKVLSAVAATTFEGKKILSATAATAFEDKKVLSAVAATMFESKKQLSAVAETIKMNINPDSARVETIKNRIMKIQSLKLSHLRNDEHFQLMKFVLDLGFEVGADKLKVESQFTALAKLHAQEDEAIKKITKSAFTAQINEVDAERDDIFRGLVNTVLAAQTHFLSDKREAAVRVGIVLDTYGNIAAKSHIEETSAVYNLCNDLTSPKYRKDTELLALSDWLDALKKANDKVEGLLGKRADDDAASTSLVLKEVRMQEDTAYNALMAMVDAQALVATLGTDTTVVAMYEAFIRRLNERIALLNDALAIRRGIAKAAKEKKKAEEEDN